MDPSPHQIIVSQGRYVFFFLSLNVTSGMLPKSHITVLANTAAVFADFSAIFKLIKTL